MPSEARPAVCRTRRPGSPGRSVRPPIRRNHPQNAAPLLQVRPQAARPVEPVLLRIGYEADPLVCPRCSGPLKIISLIGDGAVIEKILRHLKLWDRPEPPAASGSRQIHTIRSRHSRVGGRQPVVRCGRVRRTASASSPAQGGRRGIGGSVPESSPGAEQGSEARRRASLSCPVLPSVRSLTRPGSRFMPEIRDISRSPPAHSGHPHSAPQKQLPIILLPCQMGEP
jgi:hypothetical protein